MLLLLPVVPFSTAVACSHVSADLSHLLCVTRSCSVTELGLLLLDGTHFVMLFWLLFWGHAKPPSSPPPPTLTPPAGLPESQTLSFNFNAMTRYKPKKPLFQTCVSVSLASSSVWSITVTIEVRKGKATLKTMNDRSRRVNTNESLHTAAPPPRSKWPNFLPRAQSGQM